MKRFYLTGHHTFSNRGCEAIVRSTVGLLREQFGEIEVLVPSSNISKDNAQWPDANSFGVQFVPAYWPPINRYWTHIQQLPLPFLKRLSWPLPLPRWLKETLSCEDCVLSVGGDNYSLDYLLPSLLMGVDRCAMDLKIPVVLWGASVGPFEREPYFLPVIRHHLGRMTFIAARESATEEYLAKLGLEKKTIHVADPAFALTAESVHVDPFWPDDSGEGILGLNVSSLLLRFRPSNEPKDRLLEELASFIRYAVLERNLGVLLVPHVIPHDKSPKNNDFAFMTNLLQRLPDLGDHVRLMPDYLNASQTKYVISQCRFFIGARTHSTIAALSSAVPTISIAYSIKAKGINHDIFGNNRYVLNTPDVASPTLIKMLTQLLIEEQALRAFLKDKTEDMIKRSKLSSRKLAEVL